MPTKLKVDRLKVKGCKPVGDFVHCKIQDKKKFDKRSFRTVMPGDSDEVRVVIACPKGKWNAKNSKCTVSTQAQHIMFDRSACHKYVHCKVKK